MHLDGSPGLLIRSFGRRGVFLMMFGFVYLLIGVTSLALPAQRFASIPVIGPILDHQLWGLMWVVGGLVAVANGALRFRARADAAGFVALLIPPGVWSIFYATSVVTYVATGGQVGRIESIPGAAVWALVWLVVTLISGWPDADLDATAGK